MLLTGHEKIKQVVVRFQVLTAASMMFRAVFWVILPCKMIVDRRFRGAYSGTSCALDSSPLHGKTMQGINPVFPDIAATGRGSL
jgi:hypothetical protein